MQERGSGPPRVAYVLDQYPSRQQTEAQRQMRGLAQWHGLRVLPLAVRRGPEPAAVSEGRGPGPLRAVYCPARRRWRLAVALLLAGLRRPVGMAAAVSLAAQQGLRHPRRSGELMRALPAAAYFSLQLPPHLRHVHATSAGFPATVALLLAEMRGLALSLGVAVSDLSTGRAGLMARKLAEAEFATVATAYARDMLLRLHPLGSRGKLHVIPPGVDTDQYRAVRRRGGRPLLVVCAAPLVERKGLPVLLRAAGILRARGAELRLVIIGEGPEREDLARLTTGLGLQDTVELVGDRPPDQVRAALAQAEAVVLASVVAADGDRDELPASLVEALACGTPVVATAIGGLPELIEPERTGLLAKPGDPQDLADQLERILYDEELRAAVAGEGRERVLAHYRLDRCVARLAELLGTVLQAPQTVAAAARNRPGRPGA